MSAVRIGPRAGALGFALVLGLAWLARLWGLGRRSLWIDEASTWTAAHGTLAELIHFSIHEDASPPLFYMLTSLALRLGDGETQLRLVSVIASLAIVWLTYRFARLHAARGESLLAAALVALSPYQIMYAQESRTYMLVSAWMTLTTYLFARAVWHDRPRLWPFYALAMTAALYTQAIGLLAAGAHGALMLLSRDGRRQWRGFTMALLGAIALYLPWVVASMQQAGHLPQSHWYVPSPDARGTFQVLRAILISPLALVADAPGMPGLGRWLPASLAQGLLFVAPLLPLALALPALLGRDRRGATLRLAAAAVLLPLAAVYVVSLRSPLWLPRYFVFTTPFLAVLIAHGLWRLRPAPLRALGAALLVALLLFGVARYQFTFTKEPWRAAAARIADTAGSPPLAGDAAPGVAVLVPFDADALQYYFRRSGSPPAVLEVAHRDDPFASGFTPAQLDELEAAARDHTAPFDEVWVAVRSANSPARREAVRRTEAVAGTGRLRAEEIVFDSSLGPVRLVRFVRTAAPPEAAAPAP
jgi:4-amino-4-deoxy-L-arabinose transferase-like glycosyltransferase